MKIGDLNWFIHSFILLLIMRITNSYLIVVQLFPWRKRGYGDENWHLGWKFRDWQWHPCPCARIFSCFGCFCGMPYKPNALQREEVQDHDIHSLQASWYSLTTICYCCLMSWSLRIWGFLYARRSRALTYLTDVEKQSSDIHLLALIVQYPVLVEPYDRPPLAIAIPLWYDISSMSSCKVQKTEFKSFCLVKLFFMSLSKSSLLILFHFSLQLSLSSLFLLGQSKARSIYTSTHNDR